MEEYKFFVSNLADNSINRIFLNSDKEHALVVLANLFRHANKEIRIFAANLCENIGDEPEYIEAISEFIEREGHVRILLNKYNEDLLKKSNLFKRLAYYVYYGSDVIVKTTSIRPFLSKDPEKKEVHFTVMDETGYRIETDIENRTAECNFNSPVMAKGMVNFFDKIFDDPASEKIDIKKMFYGAE